MRPREGRRNELLRSSAEERAVAALVAGGPRRNTGLATVLQQLMLGDDHMVVRTMRDPMRKAFEFLTSDAIQYFASVFMMPPYVFANPNRGPYERALASGEEIGGLDDTGEFQFGSRFLNTGPLAMLRKLRKFEREFSALVWIFKNRAAFAPDLMDDVVRGATECGRRAQQMLDTGMTELREYGVAGVGMRRPRSS